VAIESISEETAAPPALSSTAGPSVKAPRQVERGSFHLLVGRHAADDFQALEVAVR
jgi:hypothetical protein